MMKGELCKFTELSSEDGDGAVFITDRIDVTLLDTAAGSLTSISSRTSLRKLPVSSTTGSDTYKLEVIFFSRGTKC